MAKFGREENFRISLRVSRSPRVILRKRSTEHPLS